MNINKELDSAQKVSMVIEALKVGELKTRREDEDRVRELLALPRGVTGLVNISKLSPETLAFARATAIALAGVRQEMEQKRNDAALSMADAQCQLFHHYEELFSALTGTSSDSVESIEEIKSRILDRIRRDPANVATVFNAKSDELEQFYRENSGPMFDAAKSLGGLKAVCGGQRQFLSSALAATRIAGLYCDTQLIPDPIYPFFVGDLHLNASHLQLAINLFHILPLRPLIDARLPEPPITVFPSFEEPLEEKDAVTQAGIADLVVKFVAPACGSGITTVDELFEYASKHEQPFLDAVTRERLFIPPGVTPETVGSAAEAAKTYLRELKGVRDEKVLEQMRCLPSGVLVLNGILERLRPQYHLLENAEELGAQPLLSQPTHWYYFERCSHAETRALVNDRILSKESFNILRALQDDSLTWLANVPVSGLAELRQKMEHTELREHLKKVTAQLAAAGPAELDAVVREVHHGLEVLIQQNKKAIKDIEDKYSSRNWVAATKGALGAIAGASMHFIPSLAAATRITAPIAITIGALGTGGLDITKNTVGRSLEKRKAKRSMVGMLATARLAANKR
jgi:hypothetical protein